MVHPYNGMSATEGNETLRPAVLKMNLEDMALSERCQMHTDGQGVYDLMCMKCCTGRKWTQVGSGGS